MKSVVIIIFAVSVSGIIGQGFRVNPKCSQEEKSPRVQVTGAVGTKGEQLTADMQPSVEGERLVIPPEIKSFILNCSFHKPIKWGITRGILVNDVTRVENIRSLEKFGNWTPTCFSVNLIFDQVREGIGAVYKCYTYTNDPFADAEEAIVELYPGPRNSIPPGFLYHRGRTDNLMKSKGDKSIFLPCAVTLPSVTVSFYFSANANETWTLIPQSEYSYPFHPLHGANLKRSSLGATTMSHFFIKCETNITGDVIIYNYTEYDFRVEPKTPATVKVFTLATSATHEFTCEATYAVTMTAVKEIPQVSYEISYSSTSSKFKAKAKIDYIGNDSPSREMGRIDCLKNGTILQTWHHKLYHDAALRLNLRGLSFDGKTRTVTCASMAAADIAFRYVACETPEECQMKMSCMRDRKLGCKDEMNLGAPSVTPYTKSVKLPAVSGFVHCLGVDVDSGATFFLNVDRLTISKLVYDEMSLIAVNITNKMQCSLVSAQVGDTIECSCLLVKRFYARTPLWSFMLKNGSNSPFILESTVFETSEDNRSGFHYGKSKARLLSPDINGISCYGLFSQSEGEFRIDWNLNVTLRHLNITGTAVETIELEDDHSDINLTCVATSFPAPRVEWRTAENVEMEIKEVLLNDTTTASTMYILGNLFADSEGNFTCEATTNQTQLGGGFLTTNKLFILLGKKGNGVGVYSPATVAIVIGFSVVVAVCILTAVYVKIRFNKRNTPKICLSVKEIGEFLEGNPNIRGDNGYENAQRMPFVNTRYQIDLKNLEIDDKKPLGEGAYGVVLKGFLKGSSDEDSMKVAVKMVKPNAEIEYLRALLGELKVMAYIGAHTNIVDLVGAVTANLVGGDLYIVIAFYPNGGLDDFLVSNRATFINHVEDGECVPATSFEIKKQMYKNQVTPQDGRISTLNLLQWSLEIALGMEYLSTKKVIHGDLAARNVLLDENLVAKVSDFGLSRQLYQYAQYVKTTKAPLPWRSMAVETICDMCFSVKSDVWAYGVTLWEIFSLGAVPYPAFQFDDLFITMLKEGYRMSTTKNALKESYEIMNECWQLKPGDRPKFSDIVLQQKNILTATLEIMMKHSQSQPTQDHECVPPPAVSNPMYTNFLEKAEAETLV